MKGTILMKEAILTTKDEIADCSRCDHRHDNYEECMKKCSSDHFWAGYERTVVIGENTDESNN